MKSHPTRIAPRFLCFVFFAFVIIISCSKDDDNVFRSAVLNDVPETVEEDAKEDSSEVESNESTEDIPVPVEKDTVNHAVEKIFETRTSVFPPINDAYLQGSRGYDQDIVRLEEGRRTSYLMFDLSPIDSIGGTVNTSNLEFTIDIDDGTGTISVFKGTSNDWSEEALSAKTAPEAETLVGELSTRYDVGQTQEIALDTALVRNEILTLVLVHEEGNDLAFASKENPKGNGPALVVTYSAPQDAEAIFFEDDTEIALHADVPTDTTNTAEEDTAEENTANQEIAEEETTEEEAAVEETADEETNEEETTAEETEDNGATADPNATEEDTTEETTNGEAAIEETADEETQEEETGENAETTVENTPEEETQGGAEEETQEEETRENGEITVENTPEEETQVETEGETQEEELTKEEANSEADAPQNEAPNAVAEASPSSGDAPLEVHFKANNSSDDQGVKDYVWDFRDGSTSTEANPTHTFDKAGTLEVRLTVTDDQGESDTDTVTITINEPEQNEAPKAVASANPTSGEATLEVQFKGSDSNDDKDIKNYFWDFKDGAASTSTNPSHSFSEAGTYEVELSVTDEEGAKDSETVTIEVSEVENKAPEAVISGGSFTGDAPFEVEFQAWNSKDDNEITGYFWDFKDGSTTTNKNPSHIFSEPGEYEVELSVKDAEGLTDATTTTVTVKQRPTDNGGDAGTGGDDNDNGNDTGSGSSTNGGESSSGGSSSGSSNSGNYPSNAVFASDFGFRSGDATTAFKAAINSGSSYVVIDKQSSDWVIQPTRFFDLRNMTIVFEPGVTVRAKSGAFGSDGARMFQLTRASNVTIEGSGATFRMNKSEYSSGEQRHALDISQSNGVTVRGLTIRESGGDGVHIAGDGNSDYSQNITLENIKSLNNKRDGICIVSAQDVWVRNSEFSQSSGKKPEAGVTIEADKPTERLVNINFIGCKFSGNDSAGFHFSTTRMNGGSRPISVKVVDCEFSNNLVSPTNTTAEVYIGGGLTNNPVDGEIRFERVKFNGSRNRIIFTRKSSKGFKAVFKDCDASNVVSSASNSPIRLEAHGNRNTLGGIQFDNFDIQYNRNVPFMTINAPSNGGTFTVKDVTGSFDIQEPNDNPLRYSGGYRPSENQNVSIDYNHN